MIKLTSTASQKLIHSVPYASLNNFKVHEQKFHQYAKQIYSITNTLYLSSLRLNDLMAK